MHRPTKTKGLKNILKMIPLSTDLTVQAQEILVHDKHQKTFIPIEESSFYVIKICSSFNIDIYMLVHYSCKGGILVV